MERLMENMDMQAAGDWQLMSAERYFWQAGERRRQNVIRSKSALFFQVSCLPAFQSELAQINVVEGDV